MGSLAQDLKYALRSFLRSPGFALVAVVTLALGIGANTAIFSVVDSVILRPLPIPDSERIVNVGSNRERNKTGASSWADYADWRDQSTSFEQLSAFHDDAVVLTGRNRPDRLQAMATTPNLMQLLRVQPALGRTFSEAEGKPGASHVAMLTYAGWQHRFHGDPDVIGTTVVLDDQPHTVIGVLPADFSFALGDSGVEIWLPMPRAEDDAMAKERGLHYLNVLGRLKPGVTLAQARSEMDTINDRLMAAYPEADAGRTVNLIGLHDALVKNLRPALWILLGAVGFVLLIACANVANILLARASVRHRELAIRVALGASRRRVIRQMLTESVLLSVIGGGLGLMLALWGLDAMRGLIPPEMARVHAIGIDGRVLAFTIGISFLTGLVFGIVPALSASGPNPNDALRAAGTRATATGAKHRARNLLVAGEIAFAVMLLIGAGLMIKSFSRLNDVSPGFSAEHVTVGEITLPDARYHEEAQQIAFYKALLERMHRVPGVEDVTLGMPLPFTHNNMSLTFTIEGQPPPEPGHEPVASFRTVSPSFFATLRVPIKRGRPFTAADDEAKAPGVVIVNETFARKFYPGQDALGQHITIGAGADDKPVVREIIAIVGDVKFAGLDVDAGTQMYVPFSQIPFNFLTFAVRTSATSGLPAELTAAIQDVDKELPLGKLNTMTEAVSGSLAPQRLNTLLLGIFGAVALILAVIGVYGVMSYMVTQRTHEIGIRVALGARPTEVIRMVVRQGMTLALAGIGVGIVGALALSRVLGSLLFGVTATDPATYLTIAGILGAVSLFASFVPARRAARVDPMIALRSN